MRGRMTHLTVIVGLLAMGRGLDGADSDINRSRMSRGLAV